MIYRVAGQFKTTYAADQAIFPIALDRWVVLLAVLAAFVVPSALASEYMSPAAIPPTSTSIRNRGFDAMSANGAPMTA